MRKNILLENMKKGKTTALCQIYFPSATLVEWIGLDRHTTPRCRTTELTRWLHHVC